MRPKEVASCAPNTLSVEFGAKQIGGGEFLKNFFATS